jgi:hypothetical protein
MHPPFFIELFKRHWTPNARVNESVSNAERHWILELWKGAESNALFG